MPAVQCTQAAACWIEVKRVSKGEMEGVGVREDGRLQSISQTRARIPFF
jgi:hypothetical protein